MTHDPGHPGGKDEAMAGVRAHLRTKTVAGTVTVIVCPAAANGRASGVPAVVVAGITAA